MRLKVLKSRDTNHVNFCRLLSLCYELRQLVASEDSVIRQLLFVLHVHKGAHSSIVS
jgi:hypothetical protein